MFEILKEVIQYSGDLGQRCAMTILRDFLFSLYKSIMYVTLLQDNDQDHKTKKWVNKLQN